MTPRDRLIEAMCKAVCELRAQLAPSPRLGWDQLADHLKEQMRREMRAALAVVNADVDAARAFSN